MFPYLMTGTAHEGGSEKVDGRVVVFPSTSPKDLRVTVYDPLRGVPVAELEVIKSKEKLRHG
jgi:putative transposase